MALTLSYCVFIVATESPFESNILTLLPESQNSPDFLTNPISQRQFVIAIGHQNADAARSAAIEFRKTLEGNACVNLTPPDDDLPGEIAKFLYPFRGQLLTSESRRRLGQEAPQQLVNRTLQELYSPSPVYRPYNFIDDPFNFAGEYILALLPKMGNIRFEALPYVDDGLTRNYLIRASLACSPFELGTQKQLATLLKKLPSKFEGFKVHRSGVVFHAAEAATMAKQEITSIGTISIVGSLLLVLVVFRSINAVIAIATVLTSSVIVAFACTLAYFGKIHLVTLAFGSTLLGLAVDYCFHFLVKYERYQEAGIVGRKIRRGLIISVCSSVLAYTIQFFSPIPGLKQFSVFVSSGLLGAALCVFMLCYCYRASTHKKHLDGAPNFLFNAAISAYGRLISTPALKPIILIIIATLLASLSQREANDDVRALNSSSHALIEDEQRILRLLPGVDMQKYWVVKGATPEEMLQRTEMLLAALPENLPVTAISQLVPSLKQQKSDQLLIQRQLTGSNGALTLLCTQLKIDCQALRYKHQFVPGLAPQSIPQTLRDALPALMLGNDLQRAVLPHRGHSEINRPAIKLPAGAIYFDKVSQLSNTLLIFRHNVGTFFGLFLVGLAVLASVLYGKRALVLLGSTGLSLLLALVASSSEGITVFHVLALLLVTGISIDTAVFYLELGLDRDSWLAASLSTATSILVFGLLSLSAMPLLQQFGQTVFLGLISAWLVTPMLYKLIISSPNEPGNDKR